MSYMIIIYIYTCICLFWMLLFLWYDSCTWGLCPSVLEDRRFRQVATWSVPWRSQDLDEELGVDEGGFLHAGATNGHGDLKGTKKEHDRNTSLSSLDLGWSWIHNMRMLTILGFENTQTVWIEQRRRAGFFCFEKMGINEADILFRPFNKSNRVNLGQLSYIYPVLKQLRTASLVHFYTSLHSKRGRSSRPLPVWFCFLLPMLGSDCPACQMVWNGFNWFSCANIDSTCCARVLLKQRSPLLISAA